MINNAFKTRLMSIFLTTFLFALPLFAVKGGGGADTGGGDLWVINFLAIARQEIYPKLVQYPSIGVDPQKFLAAVNGDRIGSAPSVYKSCVVKSATSTVSKGNTVISETTNVKSIQQGERDPEVTACYDGDKIYISQRLWFTATVTGGDPKTAAEAQRIFAASQAGIVAHEVFRMMNIGEGDDYKFSSMIPLAYAGFQPINVNSQLSNFLDITFCKTLNCSNIKFKDFPGLRTATGSKSELGNAAVLVSQGFLEIQTNVVRNSQYSLIDDKIAKRSITLFAATKDIKIIQTKTGLGNRNGVEKTILDFFSPLNQRCYMSIFAFDDQEPSLTAGSFLVRKGEIFGLYRAYTNFYDNSNLDTFTIELITPGRMNVRRVICPKEIINENSTAIEISTALSQTFQIVP